MPPTGSPSATSLFEALFGLFWDPVNTVQELLSPDKPRFVGAFVVTLLVVLFGPIVFDLARYDFLETNSSALFALLAVVALTSCLFIVLELFFLRFSGYRVSLRHLSAAFCYGCAPLTLLALVYFAANLIVMEGRLTIIVYMITGVRDADDSLIQYFPYLHVLAKIWFLFIFYQSLRIIAPMGAFSAFVITLASCVPFYLSLLLATVVIGILFPGTLLGLLDLGFAFRKLL